MPLTQGSGKYIIFLLKAVIYRILVFEARNRQSRQLSEPFRRAFDFVMVQLNVVGVAEVERRPVRVVLQFLMTTSLSFP